LGATRTPVFRVPGVNFGIRHFDAVVIVAAVAALAPVAVRQLCLPVAAERLGPRQNARTRTRTRTHTHAHAGTLTHTPDETLTCHMHHRARARVHTDMHTHTHSDACPTGHGVLSAPVVAVRVVLRVIVAAIVVAASIVRRRVPQHRGSHGVEWSVPHVEQLCLLKRRRVSVLAQPALGGHTAPRCRPHHAASFPDCASTHRARCGPQWTDRSFRTQVPGAPKRRRTCRSLQTWPNQQGQRRPRRKRPPSALHIEHTATAHMASGSAQQGGPWP